MLRVRGKENPKTAKATQHPRVRDLAWAAGFLEGEGSFYQSGGAKRRHRGTAYVVAYQVNKQPVQRLLSVLGGALHQRQARGKAQPVWVWRASGSRARGIIMTLFAFMSDKRQTQMRDALNCGR